MVTLDKVSKFIISDMSIHIPKGECVGIVGASGAGKTTLLKIICGLLKPTDGYIRILGKDPVIEKQHYFKNLSVFLAGRWALENDDTVIQSFELLQTIYHLPKEIFWKEYETLSKQLDFAEYQYKSLRSLSLGQRMRVELAATLIGNPQLILLDEPNVGLDENGKQVLWDLLQERCKQGATILIASHSLSDISKICTRIALLDKGHLLYYGAEQYLRNKYASVNRIEMTLTGSLPDLEDLPIKDYQILQNKLTIHYNVNYLSAADILEVILMQTNVSEVNVIKPDLADIILRLKGGNESEFH